MIVVSGEALMDVFDAGATPQGVTLDARIGGSPLNVAIGLARLGQPVAFFAGLSRGFLGDRLLKALQDEGVGTGAVVRVDAPTTLGLVGLDAQGVASYAFYGEGAADRQLTAPSLDRVPAAQAYHFGSYACVVPPACDALAALVERERARSVISYDINVRLNVAPDVARWRARVDWMAARTHLLKCSAEDADLLHPGEPHAAIARRWLAAGVALVVITDGGAGVKAWTPKGAVALAAEAVAVVDTVGAGDTFQAAMLAALAERGALTPAALRALEADLLTDVLGFASRAAAVTCSRRGADLPRRAEVR